jgi:hypothetical protein
MTWLFGIVASALSAPAQPSSRTSPHSWFEKHVVAKFWERYSTDVITIHGRVYCFAARMSLRGDRLKSEKRPKQAKRIHIEVSDKALSRLEWLREETDAMSIAEVIRDAIELREMIVKLANEGHTLYAENQETGEKTRLLLPL